MLGVLLFLLASGFVILKTGWWKNAFLSYLNHYLGQNYDLTLEVKAVQGNLYSSLELVEPRLLTSGRATIASAAKIDLAYHLKDLRPPNRCLRQLHLIGLQFIYPNGIDSLRSHLARSQDTTRGLALQIEEFLISAAGISRPDSQASALLNIAYSRSKLQIANGGVTAECDTADLEVPTIGEQFRFKNLIVRLQQDTLWVEQCDLQNRAATLKLAGEVLFKPQLQAHFRFQLRNLLARERLAQNEPFFSRHDFLNLAGELMLTGQDVQLKANFDGRFRNRRIQDGRLVGGLQQNRLQITQFSCRADSESFQIGVRGELNRRLVATVALNKINTQAWDLTRQKTDLNGRILLTSDGPLTRPQILTVAIDLQQSTLETFDFNYVQGGLRYEQGFVTISDTLRLKLGETQLSVTGLVNLNDSTLDCRAYFNGIKADLLADFLQVDTLLGQLDGFIEATGNLTAPDLRGWVRGHAFGLPNITFEEGIGRFGLVNLREGRYGDVFFEATNARTPLIKEEIPLTSLIIRFEGDTTFVQMAKIVSERLDIEAQGWITGRGDVALQKLKIQRGGNLLSSLDPIRFNFACDTIKLRQMRFALNRSRIDISTALVKYRLHDLKVQMNGLSLALVNDFFPTLPPIGGQLQGTIEYRSYNSHPILKGNLVWENGRYAKTRFKQLLFDGVLNEKQLQIGNIKIVDLQDGYLMASGRVGSRLLVQPRAPFYPDDSLNISVTASNFHLGGDLGLPARFANLESLVSGSVLVYHTLCKPRLSYDLNLDKPAWGDVKAQVIHLKGIYQDDRLSWTEILAVDDGGTMRGRGYMGFTLSFAPLKVHIAPDAPVSVNLTAHSTNLSLLAALIDDLESATGNFDLALGIAGTFAHPIRSGNISIKNATLTLESIENPITGVNGSAVVKNNILEIVSFTGFMKKPLTPVRLERFREKFKAAVWDVLFPPKIAPEVPNLNITGRIDLTTFFRPRYDLKLEGEDIYIRTLLAEQEGTLNAAITVKGRDTLAIEGEVDIIDFVLRNEFNEERKIAETPTMPSSIFKTVNLHTMIPGSFYFQNSQLDCELEGELWITQAGTDPYRFAGTLDVRKGKFFYLGWEFELLSGTIIFEPTDFNPILDIEAQVDLASYGLNDTTVTQTGKGTEYVTVKLSGYLDDPSLTFESANYSQSDILMYLMRTQNFTSQGLKQEQISADAMNIFGRYFERQIEKNITRFSGLDEFELRTRSNLLAAQSNDQWSILLGRKIAPNLYFKYERTFNLLEPYQQFGLEYRLNRNMSLVGEIDQNGLFNISYSLKFRY